jgi:phosphatidylglycerophosphate synthase
VLCFADFAFAYFYKSANAFTIFIALLVTLSLNFYRDYISELKAKVSIETLRKKKMNLIILMSLISWVIFLPLQLNDNSMSYSGERWFKAILLSLMITIFVVWVPIIYVEYKFRKKQKSEDSLK